MSEQQTRMLDDPHRFLWIATGTKTGKTVSEAQYLIEGIASGERCAWIGPYYKRTRTGFDHIAGAFAEAARAGLAVIRENKMQISLPASGGVLECFSGDAPDSIYGERFDRVAVDEATRMQAAVLPAVISVVTATGGKVRFAFNLDRGRRHWAVQGFLNARAGGDPDHGYVFMTTAESPYVSAESIDAARRVLPDAVFRALYLGEIQEDGAGVFRNVESLHAGVLEEPTALGRYVIGVDLARKNDWTVAVVLEEKTKHVVALERFHGAPWNTMCDRIATLARKYRNALVVPDATGVGDMPVEVLHSLGVRLEPVVITGGKNLTDTGVPKTTLIQALMVAVENRAFTFPASLEVLTNELSNFEYDTTASGSLVYSAPEGMHDDAVMALALAMWGARFAGPDLSVHPPSIIHGETYTEDWGSL
jgi:phage terminase large subunit-like protein